MVEKGKHVNENVKFMYHMAILLLSLVYDVHPGFDGALRDCLLDPAHTRTSGFKCY